MGDEQGTHAMAKKDKPVLIEFKRRIHRWPFREKGQRLRLTKAQIEQQGLTQEDYRVIQPPTGSEPEAPGPSVSR